MPSGLQIINDDGIVTIDQDYHNFEHVSTLKVQKQFSYADVFGVGYSANGYVVVGFSVPYGPGHVIAFGNFFSTNENGFRRPVGAAAIIGMSAINGLTNYVMALPYGYTSGEVSGGGNAVFECDVFVFDKPIAGVGGGSGLQVFKSDGTVAFDSNRKYMKIDSIKVSSDRSMGSAGDNLISWSTTRRFAVISGSPRIATQPGMVPGRNSWFVDGLNQLYVGKDGRGNDLCTFYYQPLFMGYTQNPVDSGLKWVQGAGSVQVIIDVNNISI